MRKRVTRVGLVIAGLAAVSGCASSANDASIAPSTAVTVTVTQTPMTSTASPTTTAAKTTTAPAPPRDDPFADVPIDPDSPYTSDQQKYLFALRVALNEQLVSDNELALVFGGVSACALLDQAPGDSSQLESTLAEIDGLLSGTGIPSEYVAIAASGILCPQHMDFVGNEITG